jgi:hypothetical protein
MTKRTLATAPLLILLVAAFGCWQDDVAVIGPENHPALVNVTDTLSYSANGLNNVNQTFTWAWNNTGTRATIIYTKENLVPHGLTYLTITDPNGIVVYYFNIQLFWNEEQHTDSGAPGAWTVDLGLFGTTGDLDFSLIGTP